MPASSKAVMTDNNLEKELRERERVGLQRGGTLALVGSLGIAVFCAYVDGFDDKAGWMIAAWSVMCLSGEFLRVLNQPRYRAVASGLQGETFVSRILTSIDDKFAVRNQVLLPNSRSRTGHTEVDFILIGRKALYLVEAKNNAGKVVVYENKARWPVYLGGGNKVTMRNPIRQVKIQAKVLRKHLNAAGFHPIIQPTVGFSNKGARLGGEKETTVPVFTYPMRDFVRRVHAYEEKLADYPDLDQDGIQKELDRLHKQALEVSKAIKH